MRINGTLQTEQNMLLTTVVVKKNCHCPRTSEPNNKEYASINGLELIQP